MASPGLSKLPSHSEDKLPEQEMSPWPIHALSASLFLSVLSRSRLYLCISLSCCISLHILSHFTFWLGIERLLVLYKRISRPNCPRPQVRFQAPLRQVHLLVGESLPGSSRSSSLTPRNLCVPDNVRLRRYRACGFLF